MQEVAIKSTEPALEIALAGEIDSRNADEFYEETVRAYGDAPRDIVFDCAGLEFIDSTTLGTFVKIMKKAKADGKKTKLVSLRPRLKKLFTICALDTVMEIEG